MRNNYAREQSTILVKGKTIFLLCKYLTKLYMHKIQT